MKKKQSDFANPVDLVVERSEERAQKAACQQCIEIGTGMGPSHNGSKGCESGSIASGGTRSHCTCDVCF